ncbi:MAG: HDOD domain-containing protein [Deltaproteobacteria bacterium]|nr:HDOD domain-containing protein [Deltaproteobacteria bacterium]MBW2020783.1 HDOD domain-containing protein [Deltaproteobacteria bacterium]MBW2075385.1 HDOD domain-containing protein [Deltaproteobacteria bacterium]
MTSEDKIKAIESKLKTLPLVDAPVFEIICLLDDPDSNFQLILEKLTPSIGAKFLEMASSAYYGRDVRTIDYAMRVLGYNAMKQILITSALFDHFAKRSDLERFNFEKFQKQAQFCAAVSRILGEIVDYEALEDLSTVGMLHNIGKLIIAVYFKDAHKEILALKKLEGISASKAEQRVLGVTHAEIGALALKKCNVSRDICDAVRFHDIDDHIISEESNFQLQLITKESARIVDKLILPEDIEPFEIIDVLRRTIVQAQELYRKRLRIEIQSKGYKEIFTSLLRDASKLVYVELTTILQERVHQNGG